MFEVAANRTAYVGLLIGLSDLILTWGEAPQSLRWMLLSILVLAAALTGFDRSWNFRHLRRAAACTLVLALAALVILWRLSTALNSGLRSLDGRQIVAYGQVIETRATAGGEGEQIIVEVSHLVQPRSSCEGIALISCPQRAMLPRMRKGDHFLVRATLIAPVEPPFPWDYNEQAFFSRMGIDMRLKVAKPDHVLLIPSCQTFDEPQSLRTLLDAARERIIDLHRKALGQRDGDFLSSIVIGNRQVLLDRDLCQSFRDLGLSHMIAASGFNLTIVVGATWVLLRPLKRERWLLHGMSAATMVLFVALAGISSSVGRAAIMCSIFLVCSASGRRTHAYAALCIALALTVIIDPYALYDVGFQLSYCATLVLISLGANFDIVTSPFGGSTRNYMRDMFVCIVGAQISTFPLQLKYFWQFGLLSTLANALVAPMVPLVTVWGFATSAYIAGSPSLDLSGCNSFLWAVDACVSVPLAIMLGLAQVLNTFPWRVWRTGPIPEQAVAFYYFALLAVMLSLQLRAEAKKLQLVSACCLLLVAVGCLCYRTPLPPLTVICLAEGTILIDADRNALLVATEGTMRMDRVLSYFGVQTVTYAIASRSGKTGRFNWRFDELGQLSIQWEGSGFPFHFNPIISEQAKIGTVLSVGGRRLDFIDDHCKWRRRTISNNSIVLTVPGDYVSFSGFKFCRSLPK